MGLWVRVELGVMAFLKVPEVKLHHQMIWCHIQDTHWEVGDLTPLQRCSQSILQSQPTGLIDKKTQQQGRSSS